MTMTNSDSWGLEWFTVICFWWLLGADLIDQHPLELQYYVDEDSDSFFILQEDLGIYVFCFSW